MLDINPKKASNPNVFLPNYKQKFHWTTLNHSSYCPNLSSYFVLMMICVGGERFTLDEVETKICAIGFIHGLILFLIQE